MHCLATLSGCSFLVGTLDSQNYNIHTSSFSVSTDFVSTSFEKLLRDSNLLVAKIVPDRPPPILVFCNKPLGRQVVKIKCICNVWFSYLCFFFFFFFFFFSFCRPIFFPFPDIVPILHNRFVEISPISSFFLKKSQALTQIIQ